MANPRPPSRHVAVRSTADAVPKAEEEGPLPAGALGRWLDGLGAALSGGADADVPCGECSACCTSSQFVHVGPDEIDALAHLPAALLVPAPGLPAGHLVLGYDELGRCPMLVESRCSIYDHRPRTCRTYDCRIFPATGTSPEEPTKAAIAARARRWRFDIEDLGDGDVDLAAALRTAADDLRSAHPAAPATAVAVEAVRRVVVDRRR